MSFIKASALGPLTASNTATIVDPATPTNGTATLGPVVSFNPVSANGLYPITFSGIPSWAKRVTLNFDRLTGGTSSQYLLIQLGTSGGTVTSGYSTASTYWGASASNGTATNGWQSIGWYPASNWMSGTMFFHTVGSNIWIGNCLYFGESTSGVVQAYNDAMQGRVALSGALTSVVIGVVSGSTAFSGGTVSCMYE